MENSTPINGHTAGVLAGSAQRPQQISIASRSTYVPSAPLLSNYTNEGQNRHVGIIDDPPPPYPGPPPGESSL